MSEHKARERRWALIALAWVALLCFVPDPRPLATPSWSIELVRTALRVQEPAARVIAAIAMRMAFLGVLGGLLMLGFGTGRFDRRGLAVLLLAPVVGLVTLAVDQGHMPLTGQMRLAVPSVLAGAFIAMLLRRNWPAGVALLGLLGILYGSLTDYTVEDDLAAAARSQVQHLMAIAPSVPDGDQGFVALTRTAFKLAAKRSALGDPVLENQAAVLGLALVLGDEKLAKAAQRYVDPGHVAQAEALRTRITLHERADWSRHFSVSAGLVVLSGGTRTINVGVVKELKDAHAGGSGFSFGDLAADIAGEHFAKAATRDVPSAVAMQQRLKEPFIVDDIMPAARDLPEGIRVDEFEARYGGVGGALTDSLVQVIRQRVEATPLLR